MSSAETRPAAGLTVGELRALIRAELADAFAELGSAKAPVLVDANDAARALGICTATLHRMVVKGCPCVRIGVAKRFEIPAVVAWLKERKGAALD